MIINQFTMHGQFSKASLN